MIKTSIIIVTFNKLEYTINCIESIRKYTENQIYEIIIVDNNSTDGTGEWVKKQRDIKVILNSENLGFPKGCNQGIVASEEGNDILLLNNDIIVTENWLSNLNECLYSNDNIGAVGPVANSAAYYQSIKVNYTSVKELQTFASKFNNSNPEKWEERQKLVGFCFLIRRKTLNSIGFLDENFTPGNYEDDDYSIRIINKGYKLYLCKDTFIHHYGGISFKRDKKYGDLLEKNNNKFKYKWGFTSDDHMSIYRNYSEFIKNDTESVLEISCGTGATALYLKQQFSCKYYGFEDNLEAGKIAKNYLTTLNSIQLKVNQIKFDIVFVNNIKNLSSINLTNVLNNSSQVVANIPADSLIDEGLNLNIENTNKFMVSSGFVYSDGVKVIDKKTGNISRVYLVYYNKILKELEKYLKNIDRDLNVNDSFNCMLIFLKNKNIELHNIFFIIEKYIVDKINILNSLAVLCYENDLILNVIPIFNEALKYEKDNYMILMNYSEVLFNIGEYEIALAHMSKVKEKDEEWEKLRNLILKKKNFISKC